MNNRRSRFLCILIALFCLLACCGCIPTNPAANRVDERMFYANIKPDANADYGKKAAIYNDRIYYLSAEGGEQGIHSMNADGSDVRLEQAAEDIRALAVNANGLYYAGYLGVRENWNGKFRCFRLYHRADAQSAPVDLLAQTKRADDLTDENVWDFYIASNGYIYIRLLGTDWPVTDNYISLITYINGEILPSLNYRTVVKDWDGFDDTSASGTFRLVQYAKQYSAADNRIYDQNSLQVYAKNYIALYDATVNRTVLPIDSLFLATTERKGYARHRWILRIKGKNVLLAAESALLTYNLDTYKAADIITFPSTESIYASFDTGEDVLLLTRNLRGRGWFPSALRSIFQIPTLKGSCLYRANPDTGAITKLLSLKWNEAFLSVDGETAATASGKTVSIYDIRGDTPALVRTIRLSHTIVGAANKVDTAGGWLFLYGYNEWTARDELLEKVYIG